LASFGVSDRILASPSSSLVRRIAGVAFATALAGVYFAMLQSHAGLREAPLVVLYTAGPALDPPRHPDTNEPGWASPRSREEALAAVEKQRKHPKLCTFRLRAEAPDGLVIQEKHCGAGSFLLAELPADSASALEKLRLAVTRDTPDLAIVATQSSPEQVLDALPGRVAMLPGTFWPGVPGDVEVQGTDRLVAPWVDSRWRFGELFVNFEPVVELSARSLDIPVLPLPATAPVLVGVGSESLFHDGIHFQQAGLARVLAERMRQATGADVSLVNYLSVRTDLVGPVDLGRLRRALPFHNQVVLLTLDGAAIQSLLYENVFEDTRYLAVGGLEVDEHGVFRDDTHASLVPSRGYRVATVDYLANGARGKRPIFTEGSDVVRTGLYTDRMILDVVREGPVASAVPNQDETRVEPTKSSEGSL
jgi:hypothetical protein